MFEVWSFVAGQWPFSDRGRPAEAAAHVLEEPAPNGGRTGGPRSACSAPAGQLRPSAAAQATATDAQGDLVPVQSLLEPSPLPL
jgi:hypothetical protein